MRDVSLLSLWIYFRVAESCVFAVLLCFVLLLMSRVLWMPVDVSSYFWFVLRPLSESVRFLRRPAFGDQSLMSSTGRRTWQGVRQVAFVRT